MQIFLNKNLSHFIPGNVPSSKNSRTFNFKLKRSFASPLVQKYQLSSKKSFLEMKENFDKIENKTVNYHFHFIRDSKRRFDYHNAIQIIADLMQDYEIIEDDDSKVFKPFFDYSYNKENPGVIITPITHNIDFIYEDNNM